LESRDSQVTGVKEIQPPISKYPQSRADGQQPVERGRRWDWGLGKEGWAEGGVGKRVFAPEKWQLAGVGQQMALPMPKRGSPLHALIELVFWLRLGEGIAGKALFIEEDDSAVILLP
jgi:hypothetical protein